MVREVITINVGGCGVRMGHRLWKQYCAESHISKNGYLHVDNDEHPFTTFFDEKGDAKFQTRNLMVDTEGSVVESVRNGAYSAIYDDDCLLFGNQCANNNFAKAYYRLGAEMMDRINDRLRKMVDDCDNVQGFIMNHSVGGGTGSGLGSLILDEGVTDDYRKKAKVYSIH